MKNVHIFFLRQHLCISCLLQLYRIAVQKNLKIFSGKHLQQSSFFLSPPSFRSSHQSCSIKKGVLRNLTTFTGKHLCQSCRSEACSFIKKETLAQVFSCEFCEMSKSTFFIERIWWWLLLFKSFVFSKSCKTRLLVRSIYYIDIGFVDLAYTLQFIKLKFSFGLE